jgi:AbrB family looped-hinge helix DNA binding protein
MSEPHGPIKISVNRQIALPKALLDRLRLQPGDQVFVLQSDAEPDGLVVVPLERVSEWIRLGRAAERQDSRDPVERVHDDG